MIFSLNYENIFNYGWAPLLLPLLVSNFYRKKRLGFHLALFFSVLSWVWIAVAADIRSALFGMSLSALSSVFYIVNSPNRGDFSRVIFQLFSLVAVGTLFTAGGFSGGEYGWTAWTNRLEAEPLQFPLLLFGSLLPLLGKNESTEENKGDRLLSLNFWPQAVSIQLLARVVPSTSFAWISFLMAFIICLSSFFIEKQTLKRSRLQQAIYLFSVGCLLSGLGSYGQILFLILSLPNIFLNEFNISNKNRWPLVAMILISSGLIGFIGSGVVLRSFIELWSRPYDLIGFSAVFIFVFGQLWKDVLFGVSQEKAKNDSDNASLAFILLSAALQIGVLLSGTWSGRFLPGDSDNVWQGAILRWPEISEHWNESVGLLVFQIVLSFFIGFALKSKHFATQIDLGKQLGQFAQVVSKRSLTVGHYLEKVLIRIENLDHEFGKFGVVSGELLQLVVGGGILRGILIWLSGLIFLFFHFYRA